MRHSVIGSLQRSLILCGLFWGVLIVSRAQASVGAEQNLVAGVPAQEIAAFAQEFIAQKLNLTKTPGALLVVVDQRGNRYEGGYGFADIAHHSPMDPSHNLFRIASITKVFTGIAIMQLVEKGKIGLDDDIRLYVKEGVSCSPSDAPVTVRQLLQHTGGLSNLRMVGGALRSTQDRPDLADYISKNPFHCELPSGSVMAYTNSAFTLLGRIVEVASGQSYESYISDHIFSPLSMNHSSFELTDDQKPLLAEGALIKGDQVTKYLAEDTVTRPSGDIISTTHDMGNFLIALLNNGKFEDREFIKQSTWHKMVHDCVVKHPGQGGRCLSLRRDVRQGITRFGHQGSHITHHSTLWILPEVGVGIWLGVNANQSFDEDFVEAFQAKFFPGISAVIEHPQIQNGIQDANEVKGRYRLNAYSMAASGRFFYLMDPGATFNVEPMLNGGISINGRALSHIDKLTFQYPISEVGRTTYGEIVTFLKNEAGEVITFHGDITSATKVPWYLSSSFNLFYAAGLLIIITLSALVSVGLYRHRIAIVATNLLLLICWAIPIIGVIKIAEMQEHVLFGFPAIFELSKYFVWLSVPVAFVLIFMSGRHKEKAKRGALVMTVIAAVASLLLVPWAIYWQIA